MITPATTGFGGVHADNLIAIQPNTRKTIKYNNRNAILWTVVIVP